MMIKTLFRGGLCLGAAMALAATSAGATSLTGSFTSDDAQFATTFTVSGTSESFATLRTYGYAGGINGNGQVIARGGFDPVLSVFSASGTLLGLSDDGISAPLDPVSGQGADSLLVLRLPPGVYQLVLTQYDNFPNGDLGTGFSRAGQGNFTAGAAGCSANIFCDPYGYARNGLWALDIAVSAVPEPTPVALMLAGMATLGLRLQRLKAQRDPHRAAH